MREECLQKVLDREIPPWRGTRQDRRKSLREENQSTLGMRKLKDATPFGDLAPNRWSATGRAFLNLIKLIGVHIVKYLPQPLGHLTSTVSALVALPNRNADENHSAKCKPPHCALPVVADALGRSPSRARRSRLD